MFPSKLVVFLLSTSDIEKGNMFLCNLVYSWSFINNKSNPNQEVWQYIYILNVWRYKLFLCAAVDHVIFLTKQCQSTLNGHMHTISRFDIQTVDYV